MLALAQTTETGSSEPLSPETRAFARAVRASRRVRWEIDRDVLRARQLDRSKKFLPDGLSLIGELSSLSRDEKRFLSQIQGRTYANVFGLVERFINAKVLELSRDHSLGDQIALEGLVRFSDEELKHQELFRRIERLAAQTMPAGYTFLPDPNEVARVVLGKQTWAVLALTLHIELFTQKHYQESIEPDEDLSELYKDVFLYHWKEEAQHALIDELELLRCDRSLTAEERDRAVNDFTALILAVDDILQLQASADVAYFASACGRAVSSEERALLSSHVLRAYRWQYILSGAQHPRFLKILTGLVTEDQAARVAAVLATLQ